MNTGPVFAGHRVNGRNAGVGVNWLPICRSKPPSVGEQPTNPLGNRCPRGVATHAKPALGGEFRHVAVV